MRHAAAQFHERSEALPSANRNADSRTLGQGDDQVNRIRNRSGSVVSWTRLGLTCALAWGCASPEPPPASSLPGSVAISDRELMDQVSRETAETEVPQAPWPTEGQRTLPEPDPTSGAGTLLIYTAITGHTPFDVGAAPTDHWSLGGESLQGAALDKEIEEELRRRQEALDGLLTDSPGPATIDSMITGDTIAERANPRIAPRAPKPAPQRSEVDVEPVTIVAGSWDSRESMEVERASIDTDNDGRPEQILYFETGTEQLLRVELDESADGNTDVWQIYAAGALSHQARDTDADGEVDVWEDFDDGRMTSRRLDRNRNGVSDSFFIYAGDTLVEERHDSNDDGQIDRRIRYKNLFRVSSEEDRNRDGGIDTWTTYGIARGEEVVVRIERASKGAGPPDIFETYETTSGRSELTRREEDHNGDGVIDVTSVYENGKLVRKDVKNAEPKPL
jgi:hypothetical protein